MATFNSTIIARVAAGLYDLQLGNETMDWALEQANFGTGINGLVQSVYDADYSSKSSADVAAVLVANLGINAANGVAASTVALVQEIVADTLEASGAGNEGATIVSMVNLFATLTSHPELGMAARAFNTQISAAVNYAEIGDTVTVPVHPPEEALNFNITRLDAAGLESMRLTGDTDVRIDFTNEEHQVTGLDEDGDGLIEFNGKERTISWLEANIPAIAANHSGFQMVDAYSRNPMDHTDTANNFTGDIYFDGTSFQGAEGDGVSTDGNIFLGGLGNDIAYGGVGNDFLAGGGVAQGSLTTGDVMYGGRNADFFFAEFSGLDRGDKDGGTTLFVDGGNTSDDQPAGLYQSDQDSDWLLLEASDDDEPVRVQLDEIGPSSADDDNDVESRSGESMDIDDVENFDASGNLYGFLDNVSDGAGNQLRIGGRASDIRYDEGQRQGSSNYGIGSSAQLQVFGSEVANIIVAGYDNDYVDGSDGDDLLFGGNLQFLFQTVDGTATNVNLSSITLDGMDHLWGGAGDDGIVFESDGGLIQGESGDDTLWLTDMALGKNDLSDVAPDGVLRFDLGAQDGQYGDVDGNTGMQGYGGADVEGTADQTNYGGSGWRVDIDDMEHIDATGLSMGVRGLDYMPAGTNDSNVSFDDRQNFWGYNGNLHLRGGDGDNNLYSGNGDDILEGRTGNDDMMGGAGNDDFYFSIDQDNGIDGDAGDDVDVIRRKIDADGDGFWDTNEDGDVVWGKDFGEEDVPETSNSTFTLTLPTGAELLAITEAIQFILGGVTYKVEGLSGAQSVDAFADKLEAALGANPALAGLEVTSSSGSGQVVIKNPGPLEFQKSTTGWFFVDGGIPPDGASSWKQDVRAPDTEQARDRLIYKAYEDRSDNEGVDDDSYNGSEISLGKDGYAEDLVISFQEDGTRIAEDQSYQMVFRNITTKDILTITINGVNYKLQVGIDLDGNVVPDEDGVGETQTMVQDNFLGRMQDFINSFMDDDTSAGEITAFYAGGGVLQINQVEYNGEDTVFMREPTASIENKSGGERATWSVVNTSSHEVLLYMFDGRDNELNPDNVLFWGEREVNRSYLETALTAGDNISGTEAVVIDVGANNLQDTVFNTTTQVPNNTASNAPLAGTPNGFAVHGDDFLISGSGVDIVYAGTGDDRVIGSKGAATAPAVGTTSGSEILDGGRNFYAVKVLNESQARVYVLNKWEAANPTHAASPLFNLSISSITLIDQTESGTALTSGVFDDTLQFQQEDFTVGKTDFTITLDDFVIEGGVVQLRRDGAGLVMVDLDGDDSTTADRSYTRFTNFENIRTVSGTADAVAGNGQGTDTLNVQALSSETTGAKGVMYNLTNETIIEGAVTTVPGEVRYSSNAHASLLRPTIADFESLVLKVDGVENVIGGTGDDLLVIDETEAAKDNLFSGDLGEDRIEYLNAFLFESSPGVAEPTVTIKLDTTAAALGGTDTVTMKGGRVGTLNTSSGGAVDSLLGVEFITIGGRTAAGTREDDVLDVTAFKTGNVVVDYTNGRISADGVLQVTVENLYEIENVWGDANDWVIVADAATMAQNQREDVANLTPVTDIGYMSYIDFDTITSADKRVAFTAQSAAQILDVVNQNQFKFSLSATGANTDVDRVSYAETTDAISARVELDSTQSNQYVMVDAGESTFFDSSSMTDTGDRIDQLIKVEQIVASQGESVLDLTSSTKGLKIEFNKPQAGDRVAASSTLNAYDVNSVRISDLTTASPLTRTYLEFRDYDGDDGDTNTASLGVKPTATWNRIEGSDYDETVVLNSAHSVDQDTFNLRGGKNEVKYNELTRSINLSIGLDDALGTGANDGVIGRVTFTDGDGATLPGSTFHTIRSYAAANKVAAGSLTVAASQDAEDTLSFDFGTTPDKLFILGKVQGGDDLITVNLQGQADSIILSGFEFLSDDPLTNDIYQLDDLDRVFDNLTLTDVLDDGDHDTIKVDNDATDDDFNGGVLGDTLISLEELNLVFNFDFEVLDITGVTEADLTTVNGQTLGLAPFLGDNDELVIGAIRNIVNVNDFEAVVITDGTVTENGKIFVLDTQGNTLDAGSKTLIFNQDMNALSFGGTVLDSSGAPSVSTGVEVSVAGLSTEAVTIWGGNGNDTIEGAGGDDTLRGGGGDDVLDGGFSPEVLSTLVFELDFGNMGAGTNDGFFEIAAVGGFIRFNEDGTIEDSLAAPVTGTGIGDGATRAAIGNAVESVSLADMEAALGLTAGDLADVDFANNTITVTFSAQFGDAVPGDLTFEVVEGTDTTTLQINGTPASGAGAIASGNGDDYAARFESADTYLFESSKAKNGADVLNNVDATDVLDFSAFTGLGATMDGAGPVAFSTGVLLTGTERGAIVFNKGTLTATDIATGTTLTTSKITLADDAKAVILVSADPDGLGAGTKQAWNVYYVTDTKVGAGATWSVELVGTVNSEDELPAATLAGMIDVAP
jgi:hypothetical protein